MLPETTGFCNSYTTLAGVRLESNDGAGLNVQGTVSTVRISGTTVENSGGADGVFVAGADTVRVNDTTLRNSGQAGIDTRDAETVRLTDVRSVENGGKGLRVTGSDAFGRSVRLRNVSVESNDGEGLRVEGTGGDDEVVVRASTILASGNQGIDTDGPETVTVTNVTLRGNGDDAMASSSAGLSLTVRNATIDTTETAAVRAVDATSVLVSDARFENVDDTGVVVTGSNVAGRTVEVRDLSVDGAGGDGVRLRGTAGDDAATVRNVTVLGAGDSGVEVQDTETVTVRNATVTGGNDGAVELRGGSGYSATVVDLSVDNSQHAVDARNPTGITVRNVRSTDTGGDAVRITGTGVASRTATVRNVTARTADDGVYVRGAGTGDRATVEGINVSGLTRRGVFLRDVDRANVSNLTVSGAGSTGVRFRGGDRVGLRDARLGAGSDAVFASDIGTLRVSNVTVTDGGGEAAIDADAVATLLVEDFAAAPVGGNGISITQGDVSGRTVRLRDVSLDATGGFGVELRGTSVDDTAVVANATVSGSGGEAGILVDGFETPQLRNVTVTGTTGSFGSGDGIRVVDAAGGVLASGTVDDNAGAGVQLDGVDAFTIRNSTLTNNTNGVFLTRGATPEGVEINGNVIAGNDNRGVENNEPGVVDARSNYWGASDGPSSPDDFDAPFEDPVTGTLADGSGDAVSEGSSGVADVRFDPFLSAAPGVEGPPPIPGGTGRPTDPDGDGAYEDVNGDGNVDVLDVAALLDRT